MAGSPEGVQGTGIPRRADPYAHRAAQGFEETAPPIYRRTDFLDGILSATGLREGDRGKNIADFFSGKGAVGQAIARRFPGNTLWYVDTSAAQLAEIPDQEHVLIHDVRRGLPDALPTLDGAVERFGVKNLKPEEQQQFVSDVAGGLVEGGWLVIADMVSPEGMQGWHNEERRLKHRLAGHDVERDGGGHIPYRDEWSDLLERAGLEVEVVDLSFISKVPTRSWLGQFAGDEAQQEAALRQMNDFLLAAPPDVQEAFNIHPNPEADDVRIDYRLIVMRGRTRRRVAS